MAVKNHNNDDVKTKPGYWHLSRFWWLVVFFWLMVSFAGGLELSLMHIVSRNQVVLETVTRLISWIFMTILVVWISEIYILERSTWKKTIWVYVVACFLSLTVMGALAYFVEPPVSLLSGRYHSLSFAILLRLTYQLPSFWGLVAVAHAVRFYDKESSLKLREANLQTLLVQTRLKALQSQLNPHFLFNTLNSIASLVHESPVKAERMIDALGELLHLTIDIDRQTHTLREELHLLEQYLLIQRIRFGERLQIDMRIDATLLQEQVPVLILQPIAENAVKHGVEAMLGDGLIQVFAQVSSDEGTMRLEITNDGPVLKGSPEITQGRVGLTNTRARLAEFFGSQASFQLFFRPVGGCVAQFLIPRLNIAGTQPLSELKLFP